MISTEYDRDIARQVYREANMRARAAKKKQEPEEEPTQCLVCQTFFLNSSPPFRELIVSTNPALAANIVVMTAVVLLPVRDSYDSYLRKSKNTGKLFPNQRFIILFII